MKIGFNKIYKRTKVVYQMIKSRVLFNPRAQDAINEKSYIELTDEHYLKQYGLKLENNEVSIERPEILEKAYAKASENRNYEIDKSWLRSTYNWGFIAAAFVAYFTVLSNDKIEDIRKEHLEIFLICMGLIFSTGWIFVVIGSKRWQENWEAHVDALENYVTGPLFKTIRYNKNAFYSPSSINKSLSITVLLIWIAILLDNLTGYFCAVDTCQGHDSIDVFIPLALLATIVVIYLMVYSSRGDYISKKWRFFRRDERYPIGYKLKNPPKVHP